MIYFGYFSLSTIHLELKGGIQWELQECIILLLLYTVPLRTTPDFRQKWSKSMPIFRPKRLENHTLWGGTFLYSLYRGVPPPHPPRLFSTSLKQRFGFPFEWFRALDFNAATGVQILLWPAGVVLGKVPGSTPLSSL